MSIRVDLLKPSEYRRQGAVSNAFIIRVSVLVMLALTLLFGSLGMVRHKMARRDLAKSEEIWRMREPVYNHVQSMKQDLALARKLQNELGGWSRARIDWGPCLEELPRLIPANVQLRRLSIKGDTELKPMRAPARSSDDEKPAAPSFVPVRKFAINIDGRAAGEESETVVVQLVRTLGDASTMRDILEMIKLQNLQRELGVRSGQADRTFGIEAFTKQREMK